VQELFGFIASELAKFVADEDKGNSFSTGKKRELGFTFSFPVRQHSIASGTLVKWTKAFCIEDAVRISYARKYSIFVHYMIYECCQ
jgi:hexokinase